MRQQVSYRATLIGWRFWGALSIYNLYFAKSQKS